MATGLGDTAAGTLTRSERSDRVTIPTPLDGTLRVTADGGAPLDVDFELYSDAGRLLKRSATDAHRESVGYTVCGARRVKADVLRYRGAGTYALTISRP